MRQTNTVAFAIMLVLAGFSAARSPAGTAPLSEAEFDEFAVRLSQSVQATLKREGYTLPMTIARPEVLVQAGVDLGSGETLVGFALTLCDGLNDRMSGQVQFNGSKAEPGRIKASLMIGADPDAAEKRQIRFLLVDDATRAQILRESISYQQRQREAPPADAREKSRADSAPEPKPRKPATESAKPEVEAAAGESAELSAAREGAAPSEGSEKPARKAPRSGATKIKIDRVEAGLAEFIQQQLEQYAERTVEATRGKLIFLDDKGWNRFKLLGQRSGAMKGDRLRLELDIEARESERSAKLRVVFLNEIGEQVEVTPVLPYKFLPEYVTTVAITSRDAGAASFLCLIEYD